MNKQSKYQYILAILFIIILLAYGILKDRGNKHLSPGLIKQHNKYIIK